jgi:hypothetical protein
MSREEFMKMHADCVTALQNYSFRLRKKSGMYGGANDIQ